MVGQVLAGQRAPLLPHELAEDVDAVLEAHHPRRATEQRPRARLALRELRLQLPSRELRDQPCAGRAKGASRVAPDARLAQLFASGRRRVLRALPSEAEGDAVAEGGHQRELVRPEGVALREQLLVVEHGEQLHRAVQQQQQRLHERLVIRVERSLEQARQRAARQRRRGGGAGRLMVRCPAAATGRQAAEQRPEAGQQQAAVGEARERRGPERSKHTQGRDVQRRGSLRVTRQL
eukprot:scaffold100963_cov69-Phaeocystis_antarctica.AAC.5